MREDSTEEEEMKRQQRMKVMKDMLKENQIAKKGMDAENQWWVAELLAADCVKAWLHPEEETMQNRCN